MQGSLLRLGFERVGGKRIGGEQVERELASSLRFARDTFEQCSAKLRQVSREHGARSREQFVYRAIESRA